MPQGKVASWAFAEEFVAEQSLFDDASVLDRARERATELGAPPVLPGAGAVLRLLAAAVDAHAAVEIGTGAGVGSLYILAGMNDAGVLTTIDPEVENQRAARESLAEAGVRAARVRTIAGTPRDVIGRLTDHAYDLVSFAADAPHAPDLLEHALRLLRPGGVLVVTNALFHDRVPDPAARDAATAQVRAVVRAVQESDDLRAALLPSGDGVVAAVRR
ncbi:O-methyltransferase [Brachybacterium huguangmaarense]